MSEKTVRELASQPTVRDNIQPSRNSSLGLQTFQEYEIVEEFDALGSEADTFLVQKDNTQYFLKLYRKGIDLEENILTIIQNISETSNYFSKLIEYNAPKI